MDLNDYVLCIDWLHLYAMVEILDINLLFVYQFFSQRISGPFPTMYSVPYTDVKASAAITATSYWNIKIIEYIPYNFKTLKGILGTINPTCIIIKQVWESSVCTAPSKKRTITKTKQTKNKTRCPTRLDLWILNHMTLTKFSAQLLIFVKKVI